MSKLIHNQHKEWAKRISADRKLEIAKREIDGLKHELSRAERDLSRYKKIIDECGGKCDEMSELTFIRAQAD